MCCFGNISIEVLNACVNIKIYGLSDSEAEIIIIISKKCGFFSYRPFEKPK